MTLISVPAIAWRSNLERCTLARRGGRRLIVIALVCAAPRAPHCAPIAHGRLPGATAVGIASAALAVLQQVHHLTDVSVPAFVAEASGQETSEG